MMNLLRLIVCLAICGYTLSQSCPGTTNTYPIYTDAPTLVNTTDHGKLYITGGSENFLYVLHLYGEPYEMGFAQGALLKETILTMYSEFYMYVDEQIQPYLKYLPAKIVEIIDNDGVKGALDFTVLLTAPYTPWYFIEEMRGLSDALGMELADVWRMMMFPELIKASCSIIGAWGSASESGGLLQLRALDWGPGSPFVQFPTLTVYHPSQGHNFTQLGWTGFIGALTGYSPFVGASEKVWVHYNGTDAAAGIPWTFLFRDMLQFDETKEAAIKRIDSAHRTCSVYLGVGDHASQQLNIVEYSHDVIRVFTDTTPFPGFAPPSPQHPLFTDIVYVDKHTQPSSDPCMASVLQQYDGSIGVQDIITLVSLQQTGDMHIGIFDYVNDQIYVALSTQTVPPSSNATILPAYERPFIQLDMTKLFVL